MVCRVLTGPSTLDWICPGAGVWVAWFCDPSCIQESLGAQ